MKKVIIIVLFAALSFIYGKYIFDLYKNPKEEPVSSTTEETVYMLQQGAYSTEANAISNSKDLNFYIIEHDDSYYRVYVGVTEDATYRDKIKGIYNDLGKDIYIREKKISNAEFLEDLKQYDNLLKSSTSNDNILSIEKEVLGKYKELVIENGEGAD